VDAAGNVFVTGNSPGSGANSDYATIKYDANGNQIWAARYNGPANGDDVALSLVLDGAGNIYVSGWSYGIGTGADYATIKYDTNGNQIWVARYNGLRNDDDRAYSLALDSAGDVYVTGYSMGTRSGRDYATIKYDADGNQIWIARYNGLGNSWDQGISAALDASGNVYVTGQSVGNDIGYDYCTIKYSGGDIANWMPVEATVLGQPLPQECRLEGNFPNPFNASTVLSYQLPVASHVRLEVFDLAGRAVGAHGCAPSPLVDGWRSAGEHKLTFDASHLPSGIYFAILNAGDYSGTQKLILVR
jgi:hypothetical protein